jgi:drug/metabolite transporter (DMT)-like permease
LAELDYILGVSFGILSGVLSNFGNVLEKKAVISIPKEERDENFGKKLLKNPIWLTGFILAMIIDPIFMFVGQSLLGADIGPTLVPGLMASGLIVLAIGSAKIVGESLEKIDIIGIILMIVGISFLGFSNLESGDVDVTDQGLLVRITIFTSVMFAIMIMNRFMSSKIERKTYKGIMLAVTSGVALSLSNFWLSPLIATMGDVLTGKPFTGEVSIIVFIVFIIALIMLLITNYYGIAKLQVCFKFQFNRFQCK